MALLSSELLPAELEEDAEDDALTVAEQTARYRELTERFATLNIPVIVMRSVDETEDIAAYEWIKVMGVIFGAEEEATALFDAAVEDAIAQGLIEAPADNAA